MRAQAQAALGQGDLRWGLELASWLVRSELDEHGRADAGPAQDRELLAQLLRTIATRTTSANLRNWCLTRALELQGKLDLRRFRTHRFRAADVLASPPATFVPVLGVLLDPERAAGVEDEVRWEFADGARTGLRIRGMVAVPTDGSVASLAIALDLATWARLLEGKVSMSGAIADGSVRVTGDPERLRAFFGCFDHRALGT